MQSNVISLVGATHGPVTPGLAPVPRQPADDLEVSDEPGASYKAYFLDSKGTRRFNAEAGNPLDTILNSAKTSVALALKAMLPKNAPESEQNPKLKDILKTKLDWEGNYAPFPPQRVIYFAIIGRICKPFCLGFVVYGAGLAGWGMVDSKGGRGYRLSPVKDNSEFLEFLKFLEDIKKEVTKAKAENPDNPAWPVLKEASPPPSPSPPPLRVLAPAPARVHGQVLAPAPAPARLHGQVLAPPAQVPGQVYGQALAPAKVHGQVHGQVLAPAKVPKPEGGDASKNPDIMNLLSR
ncbi:hypothetical protein BDP27DRAFT_1428654 [Rhodocollybia butyracea]|uniref:Uncharacterized protein n=1 Tax=Rhodocollybia butyracea TaxID=206335 RepID=A0A9P5PD98_9AGAR|nr:hypothetical protein BDP27DRAFT_1428654 [Rhodocollybia butyracea]